MQTEVYFSALLATTPKYQKDFERIKQVLHKHKVSYDFIEGTKDIWARDYMPVHNGKGELVQFVYEPSYLKDALHLQSDPEKIKVNGSKATILNITLKLDGGNYVRKGKKVIISDRVFDENPRLDKVNLVRDLESFLHLEVVIIPAVKPAYDLTGHSDGYVRFINEHIVFVNELKNEFLYFSKGCVQAFKKHMLDWVEMPTFLHKDKAHPNSAIGVYLNYLELEDLIIFPIFDIYPVIDQKAIRQMKHYFPHKTIEPIIINDIANEGGLMNCISWQPVMN